MVRRPSSRGATRPGVNTGRKPSSRADFHLGIICALPVEFDAVYASLDETLEEWDSRGVPGDQNHYVAGRMGGTAVVLALLPNMGKAAAAGVSARMRATYVNLQYALLVGICGAVPETASGAEILLGDVVIGKHIISYDFGRQYPSDFRLKQGLQEVSSKLPKEIRMLNAFLETRVGRKELGDATAKMLSKLQEDSALDTEGDPYRYPGPSEDRLFKATYRHKHQNSDICRMCDSCSNSSDPVCPDSIEASCTQLGCSEDMLLTRQRKRKVSTGKGVPEIHLGGIASADTVMKSGEHRDQIASAHQVIAFEMEGAGVWDELPCIIIKGVCDYADSHKNKNWHQFASATAASAAKVIVCKYFADHVEAASASDSICHFIPFTPNDTFVGREKVIEELHTQLFLKNHKRAALVGLGGMGKTQIALHLAHSTVQEFPDYSVFWMPVFSMASYEQACTDLAKKLGLPIDLDNDPRESIKAYLESSSSGKWLFILDNADDEELIFNSNPTNAVNTYLPQNSNGRTLVTTRSKRIAVKIAKNILVHLQRMSYQEADSLLKGALVPTDMPDSEEEEEEEEEEKEVYADFFNTLCYLPLAISQAASYMNMNDISISEYLQLLQSSEQDMKELMDSSYDDDTYYDASQGAVMTTWQVSFSQIRERHPAAMQLLAFITWIEPKAIPYSLLPSVGSKQAKTQAIGILKGYGFLTNRKEQDMFDMHSLVHFVMHQQECERDTNKSERRKVLSHIAKAMPADDWKYQQLWQQYLPHALRAYWQFDGVDAEMRQNLGNSTGLCLLLDGRFTDVIDMLKPVTSVQDGHLEEDNPILLASQQTLARAYRSNDQMDLALSLLEHVVAVRGRVLPEDDSARLASEHELAKTYTYIGRSEEAVKLMEHVVAVSEKDLPEDDYNRLTSQHELAKAYSRNNQLKDAIKLLKYVVAITQRIVPENSPELLIREHTLASMYRSNGQIRESISLLQRVVDSYKKTLSEDHPYLINSQRVLAEVYEFNGQKEEAIDILEHVNTVYKRVCSEDDPKRIKVQSLLAKAYKSNGQVQESIDLLESIIARQWNHAEDHTRRLEYEHDLALAYIYGGRVEDGIGILSHILAIRYNLPEDDPKKLQIQYDLARAYQFNGRLEEAIRLLEHIVAVEVNLPTGDSNRIASQYTLASVYNLAGRTQEAVGLLERIVAAESALVEDHPDRLRSQSSLAMAYQETNQIEQAIKLMEHVAAIYQKSFPPDHPSRVAAENRLYWARRDSAPISP